MSILSSLTNRQHIAGVSLIELMVSLVIGSLLVIGAVTVYLQSRTTYRTNEAAARLQETARYAMDIIEPEVRLAGFWGLTNVPQAIENRAAAEDTEQAVASGVTNNCGNNWVTDVIRFLDGRDNGNYDLTCNGTSPADWSDVLIVRRVSAMSSVPTNGRFQVQSNRIRGTIFRNGALPDGYAVSPTSETRDLIVRAYYVSNPSPGQFELRRQTLVGTTIVDQGIIDGVADLQIQFGIDTDGDGSADQYVNPEAATLPTARITSARVWVMVVAPDTEVSLVDGTDYEYANVDHGIFSDSRRRLVMSKTIQIRNSTP